MRQVLVAWCCFVALVSGWLVAEFPLIAAEPLVKKVLIIGIDGCRTDALLAGEAPNLKKLAETGAFSQHTDICGPRPHKADTISGPGWSNILNGVFPDKHGVTNNTFKGSNYERYPSLFTLLRKAHPDALTASYCTWEPIHKLVVKDASINRYTMEKGDSYGTGDVRVAEEASKLLAEKDPELVFAYLGNVDETGHKHGFHPSVKPYMDAIAAEDKNVGKMLEAIAKRPTRDKEDWLILVGTDHGGRGTNHGGGRDVPEIRQVFLIANGASVKQGEISETTHQVDIVATALAHLGVTAEKEWELDGHVFGLK